MRKFPRMLFAAAALALCGCLIKDKSEKNLKHGALTPPWDPAHFSAKHLDGYAGQPSDTAFAVFNDIARIDSAAGDPKTWKPDASAADTLRIGQMFDTAFVFPQNPDAIMPYGYDDSFRDDTLYRDAYGNGLYTQDHPCASIYVLSGQFLHPAKWLRTGLKTKEIIDALGNPIYRQDDVLRYLSRHAGTPPKADDSSSVQPDSAAYDVYEGVNLYFRGDSLFAAVLQKSQPCH